MESTISLTKRLDQSIDRYKRNRQIARHVDRCVRNRVRVQRTHKAARPKRVSTPPNKLIASDDLTADEATRYAKAEINAGRQVTYERAVAVVKARFRRGKNQSVIRTHNLEKEMDELNRDIAGL